MANSKISDLPHVGSLTGSELIPMVQQTAGVHVTKHSSLNTLINYIELGALADFKAECDNKYAAKNHTHNYATQYHTHDLSTIMGMSEINGISSLVDRMSSAESLLSGSSDWWYISDWRGNGYSNMASFLSAVQDFMSAVSNRLSGL